MQTLVVGLTEIILLLKKVGFPDKSILAYKLTTQKDPGKAIEI